MVWYSHLFQNFPQFVVINTIEGFGVANKAEVDVFLELSCFFYDLMDVGNLISGSSAFFLHQVWTSGMSQFMYCWSLAWRILSITLLACEMSAIEWKFEHSLALPLRLGWKLTFPSRVATAAFSKTFHFWDGNENCGHCWVFQIVDILSAAPSQHHLSGFETAQLEFYHPL